jgi:superfamily I DNA and/or RNA helicase
MHPAIARFPAAHFYGGRLDNSPDGPSRSPFFHSASLAHRLHGGGGGAGGRPRGGYVSDDDDRPIADAFGPRRRRIGDDDGGNGDGFADGVSTAVSSRGYLVRLAPYAFLDFRGAETKAASKSNPSEARVVAAVVRAARRHARAGTTVAVITPYRAQTEEVTRALGEDASAVRVGTVDGFQVGLYTGLLTFQIPSMTN